MPVVGGYLAYIGCFCGMAGVSMMTGRQLSTTNDWINLFYSPSELLLAVPGVLSGK